jgi:hypothetical protein
VLEFYPSEDIVEVDAMNSPAEVLHDILDGLVKMQDAHFNRSEDTE